VRDGVIVPRAGAHIDLDDIIAMRVSALAGFKTRSASKS